MSLAFEAMNKTKDDYELRIEQLEAEIERLNKVIDDLLPFNDVIKKESVLFANSEGLLCEGP